MVRRWVAAGVMVLSSLAIVAAPSVSAARPTVRQLEAQIKKLKESRSTWRARALDARHDARDLQATLKATEADLLRARAREQTLTDDVTAVTGQRDKALAGLPAVIAAVPVQDFQRLVFEPALAAWPCDSVYSSGTYWLYSFNSPSPYC